MFKNWNISNNHIFDFVNICAWTSYQRKEDITPYWRTLKSNGELNIKYPEAIELQKRLLEEEGHTITDLADDTFDYNGYGIGDDKEGIILCFDIMYRYYTITTSGPSCIDTYSIAALDSVYENVDPYYMENDFFGGTKAFIRYAKAAYDNYDLYHEKHNRVLEAATPALIISAIITIISFLVMSSKLKSQRVSVTAGQYMKNNNINILRSGDIYLYSNVSRTKIERMENHMSNSHSSPTHISSSGHTHGGGGSHRV